MLFEVVIGWENFLVCLVRVGFVVFLLYNFYFFFINVG